MYKISVPVALNNLSKETIEETLEMLRGFDAFRVFISLGEYELDKEKRKNSLERLSEYIAFFKQNGLEVGVWLWTFMISGGCDDFDSMVSITGETATDYICPADKRFLSFAGDYIRDIAKCCPDLIMYDDDFRYLFLSQPGCLCKHHQAIINEITGEACSREFICEKILNGAKNKYRDAYIEANGRAFKNFAKAMRKSVDAVDSGIRLGACCCFSSWDIDGVEARELSYILAGKTKPFLRLIAAPYWAYRGAWRNTLSDVIELERMESVWTQDGNIEIMAEGDVWPRPRTRCPASYLEGFDMAMRASGAVDGILKYGIDYYSKPHYEQGYLAHHTKNKPLYDLIDKHFADKDSVGIRIYQSKHKLADMVIPTIMQQAADPLELFFSKEARTLGFNTIPTTYSGNGICGIAFSENARHLPEGALNNGLIIDLAAAQILMEKGVDVGIVELGKRLASGRFEHFLSTDNKILTFGIAVCDIKLAPKAKVLSTTTTKSGSVAMSYLYENEKKQRFLVLNLDSEAKEDNVLKHYERSRQYAEAVKWLSGKKLPAYCYGNPSLYIQCKSNGNALACGMFNFFADSVFEPIVELDKEYSSAEFINCTGRLCGDKLYLSDIAPFGFVGFEVK